MTPFLRGNWRDGLLPGLGLGAFFLVGYLSSIGKVSDAGSLPPRLQAYLFFLVPLTLVVLLYGLGLVRRAVPTDRPRRPVRPWFLALPVSVLIWVLATQCPAS